VRRLKNENEKLTASTAKNYNPQNLTNQKHLTYLESLEENYAKQYKGNAGLQALIDRSGYSVFQKNYKKEQEKKEKELKEIKKIINSTKVANKEKQKKENIAITKKEKVKKSTTIAKTENRKHKIAKKETPLKTYIVKKGDNLSKIAKLFSVNLKTLKKLNHLDKNGTVKIGQKIQLPSSANIKIAKLKKKQVQKTKKDFYIVKSGDTLYSIAKKFKVSIVTLREVNRLSRSSVLKEGQKIYFKYRKQSPYRKVNYDIVKNTKFRKVPSLKFKRKIRVIATAYTSHRNQTDKTPFVAAWNNRIRPGMKIIAVSPDLIRKYGLKNGVKVKILGLPGYYVVRDKMNKRLRNHIDIYMGVNKRKALRWGRRRITLYW